MFLEHPEDDESSDRNHYQHTRASDAPEPTSLVFIEDTPHATATAPRGGEAGGGGGKGRNGGACSADGLHAAFQAAKAAAPPPQPPPPPPPPPLGGEGDVGGGAAAAAAAAAAAVTAAVTAAETAHPPPPPPPPPLEFVSRAGVSELLGCDSEGASGTAAAAAAAVSVGELARPAAAAAHSPSPPPPPPSEPTALAQAAAAVAAAAAATVSEPPPPPPLPTAAAAAAAVSVGELARPAAAVTAAAAAARGDTSAVAAAGDGGGGAAPALVTATSHPVPPGPAAPIQVAAEGGEEGERDNTSGEMIDNDLDGVDLDEIEDRAAAMAQKERDKDAKIAALALTFAKEVQGFQTDLDQLCNRAQSFESLKKLISYCPCKEEQKRKALDGLSALASSKRGRTHQSDQNVEVEQLADAVSVCVAVKLMGETADTVAHGQLSEAERQEVDRMYDWASKWPAQTIEPALFEAHNGILA